MAKSSKANQSGQSTSTLAPISKAEIEQLDQIYTIRNREEVLRFLEEHPFLIPVLFEAPEKIKLYFGKVELFLEFYTDQEEGSWSFLHLKIAKELEGEEVFRQLEQLIESWILELPGEILTNLQIDLDYK